uniref:Uncharacterized protein n=1 Tax=Odontella aurita TaxID=265563 RepID=A0A7S4NGF7_9STRA|mmetsp:Transcript_62369/g.184552  ORF Transcript_62369/g.184552 Transcript_62369/m.184552 type:complete len:295 (+) Transcript_62369:358-1242(+)
MDSTQSTFRTADGRMPDNTTKMYPDEGHSVSLKRRRKMLRKLKKLSTEALKQSKSGDVLSTVEEGTEEGARGFESVSTNAIHELTTPQVEEVVATHQKTIWESIAERVQCGPCDPLSPCNSIEIHYPEKEEIPALRIPPGKEQTSPSKVETDSKQQTSPSKEETENTSETSESESTASSSEKAQSIITTLKTTCDTSMVSDISEPTYDTSVWSGITEFESQRLPSFSEESVVSEKTIDERIDDIIVLLKSISYHKTVSLDDTLDANTGINNEEDQLLIDDVEIKERCVQYVSSF